MSGSSGSPPGNAPTKLLTILGDQPIGRVSGNSVYAEMSFVQMLQRIISYLGQPGSATASGTPTGSTLTGGIAAATAGATAATAAAAAATIAANAATQAAELALFLKTSGPPASGVVLQQGTVSDDGAVIVGPYLTLGAGSLNGQIWMPLANGDLPGPELMADPFGQVIAVQVA